MANTCRWAVFNNGIAQGLLTESEENRWWQHIAIVHNHNSSTLLIFKTGIKFWILVIMTRRADRKLFITVVIVTQFSPGFLQLPTIPFARQIFCTNISRRNAWELIYFFNRPIIGRHMWWNIFTIVVKNFYKDLQIKKMRRQLNKLATSSNYSMLQKASIY